MSATNFHPNKSRVGAGPLAEFIRKPISGDLLEVPGIGEATAKKLRENGVTTTFQLIGKYLSFKDDGVGPVEHADRFYFWLTSLGTPGGFRAGIVHSIAEKMNVTFVGIYDPDAYESKGDDEEDS